jgi:hypothetical protein
MTAEEMQYNFELKMNTLYTLRKPFQSYDINQFLNESQDQVVDNLYSVRDGDRREHFETDEKLRTELAELITNYGVASSVFDSSDAALHENGVFVTVPADFMYALREECGIEYLDCNDNTAANTVRVAPVTHDEYIMNINNSFKGPYNELVWRLDYSSPTADTKRHELITDGTYDIMTYTLRYLKRPGRINILDGSDCELNSNLHEEIVNRAVRFAAATLPQPENVEPNTEP